MSDCNAVPRNLKLIHEVSELEKIKWDVQTAYEEMSILYCPSPKEPE